VAEYLYKIRDDSVRPREFLGTNSEDGIEAILADRYGHSLHEFIDGDDPLRPIIDFDLPLETFNSIEPKLTQSEVGNNLVRAFKDVCVDIYPDWDETTLAIATSTDSKKNISSFVDIWAPTQKYSQSCIVRRTCS